MPLGDVLMANQDGLGAFAFEGYQPAPQLVRIGDRYFRINTLLPNPQRLPDATQQLQQYLRRPVHTTGIRG